VTHVIKTVERSGQWVAFAERADNGDRFGVERTGQTEGEAIDRLRPSLDW
jgi:hypothetical protein